MSDPMETADSVIVTVTDTVNGGTVVRWYPSLLAARNSCEMATASRNGVTVQFAPQPVAAAAYRVAEVLAGNRDADLSHLATHRRNAGLLAHELVPVEQDELCSAVGSPGCTATRATVLHGDPHTCVKPAGHKDRAHRCLCGRVWMVRVEIGDRFGGAVR